MPTSITVCNGCRACPSANTAHLFWNERAALKVTPPSRGLLSGALTLSFVERRFPNVTRIGGCDLGTRAAFRACNAPGSDDPIGRERSTLNPDQAPHETIIISRNALLPTWSILLIIDTLTNQGVSELGFQSDISGVTAPASRCAGPRPGIRPTRQNSRAAEQYSTGQPCPLGAE